jgi:diguanylate cyclase (GGDEF)-like protein/PAS domain S-box-containing protein
VASLRAALVDSEARYRELVEHQAELICEFLPDTTIVFANEAYARYRGVPVAEIVGRSMLDIVPPDRRADALATIRSLGPERLSSTDEGYVTDIHGAEHCQQWMTTAIIEEGTVVRLRAVGIDITARRRANDLIESERSRFAALVEHSSDLILLIDQDGTVAYVSPAVTRLLGWEPGAIRNAIEMLHPDDRERAIAQFDRTERRGRPFRTRVRVQNLAGEWRWLEIVGTNRLSDPHVGGIVLNARDVTEEVLAQDGLVTRAELLGLQARCTSRFIDVAVDLSGAAVEEALADLGGALRVDRSYVFAMADGSDHITNTHEWCAPGISSQKAELAAVATSSLPRLLRELDAGRVVHAPDVAALDGGWALERAFFAELELRSVLLVPMHHGGRLVGFVGFDSVTARRSFTLDEVAVLQSFAGALCQLQARVGAEVTLRRSEARYRALVAGVPDLLVRVDDAGVVLDWRPGDRSELGSADGAVGRRLVEVAPELAVAIGMGGDGHVRTRSGVVAVEAVTGGVDRSYEITTTAAGNESIVVVRDVTDQRQLQASLLHAAQHDALTGLANRRLFSSQLEEALGIARDGTARQLAEGNPAILYIDLDGFKVLNDSLGHEVGDEVLRALATRLRRASAPGDLVARLGGDEFAVLCHEIHEEDEAVAAAQRIVTALALPVRAGGEDHIVTASVGVVVADADSTPGALLRDADAAMYRAKARADSASSSSPPTSTPRPSPGTGWSTTSVGPLDLDQLRLHLQPVWSVRDGRWTGWRRSSAGRTRSGGLLPPAAFLDVAAEVGLLPVIGAWVVGEACRTAAGWRAGEGPAADLVIWVNLAAEQLTDPSLVPTLCRQLADAGLPTAALGIEITETGVVGDLAAAARTALGLRAAGVRVALDDFGTGLSSLTHLDQLPLDVVKLDGSFIAGIAHDDRARDLVAGIISLLHALGLEVVAEGVETAEQLAELVALDVDTVQGFHLGGAGSRPFSQCRRSSPCPRPRLTSERRPVTSRRWRTPSLSPCSGGRAWAQPTRAARRGPARRSRRLRRRQPTGSRSSASGRPRGGPYEAAEAGSARPLVLRRPHRPPRLRHHLVDDDELALDSADGLVAEHARPGSRIDLFEVDLVVDAVGTAVSSQPRGWRSPDRRRRHG